MKNWIYAIGVAALLSVGFGQEVRHTQETKLTEADFKSSRECGRCHREIYNQWSQSMHSRSFTDPIYRAVVDRVLERTEGRNKVFCLSCHAPVASVSGQTIHLPVPIDWESFSSIASEGVTCDFCHTISGNENLGRNISVNAYAYPRRGETAVKYGRYGDWQPSGEMPEKGHLVESSDFLTSAQFCAMCHQFKHPISQMETQNTYQEWLDGPYSKRGVRCQDCHMPRYSGILAEGEKPRERVHAHVFSGGHTEMIKKAATLNVWGTIEERGAGSALQVTANVTNSGSGHTIPTGLPSLREIVLEVEVENADGAVIAQREFRFGRWLLGENGERVVPWEPYVGVADNRIPPEQARQNTFDVPLSSGSDGGFLIKAQLKLELISELVSRELQMQAPEAILMTSARATVP